MLRFKYTFPENQRAAHASRDKQAVKILEEATEVRLALEEGEPDCRVLEEAADCYQAIEGLFRKCRKIDVVRAIARVKIKCYNRGDYY